MVGVKQAFNLEGFNLLSVKPLSSSALCPRYCIYQPWFSLLCATSLAIEQLPKLALKLAAMQRTNTSSPATRDKQSVAPSWKVRLAGCSLVLWIDSGILQATYSNRVRFATSPYVFSSSLRTA